MSTKTQSQQPESPVPASAAGRRWPVPSPRFWVGFAVTVAWLAVMGAVWWRQTGRIGAGLRRMGISPELLLVTWRDVDQWMWIEQNGRRVGVTHLAIVREETPPAENGRSGGRPRYVMDYATRLQLRILGATLPVSLRLQADMNEAFELQTFQGEVNGMGIGAHCQAFAEGTYLYYWLKTGPAGDNAPPAGAAPPTGAPAPSATAAPLAPRDICGRMPLAQPILLRDAVAPILTSNMTDLKTGQRWTTQIGDPLAGEWSASVEVAVVGREWLAVGGETHKAWKLRERFGQLEAFEWVDERGGILRRESAGLVFTRAPVREAAEWLGRNRGEDPLPSIDREWIKGHIDPEWRDRPLADILPEGVRL
ncbi:MAG: hypothetical protein M1457_11010 [bacterium]|nr:hypothetical protein [bacterium]